MKTLVYLNSIVFYTLYATDPVEPWSLFNLCNYLARFCPYLTPVGHVFMPLMIDVSVSKI